MYNLTPLGVQLNEYEALVAPTDSRNRPDIRLMEETLWDEASATTKRIEDKQRRQEKSGAIKKPLWFENVTDCVTNKSLYVTNRKYWACKESQEWKECPNLFL